MSIPNERKGIILLNMMNLNKQVYISSEELTLILQPIQNIQEK
jgi:hypothetical protein